MELKEQNRVYIGGKGILTVTKKGTRKFKDGKMIDPGEIVKVVETLNIICNEGLLLIAGFTIDESGVYDVGLVHCEIGTDNTAPVAGDTTLGAFHHRNTITNDSRAAYETTFATFFTGAESDAAIEEAGIWGGGDSNPDAGGEATGLLFAHWLASFDNTGGTYDLTITYVLTISRG
ncbi:hypothetical protein ES703_96798 [subsurface metagenome]